MESLMSMEYLMSIDSIICLLSGGIVGLLLGLLIEDRGFGLIGNTIIGMIGGVLSGGIFNGLDFLNVGDYADPIIAGVVGGLILVGIATLRKANEVPQETSNAERIERIAS